MDTHTASGNLSYYVAILESNLAKSKIFKIKNTLLSK